MNSLTNKFNNQFTIDNIAKITKTNLSELPHYDTINDVFDDLNIDELRKIQKYIVNALIRSKMFDKFRYKKNIRISYSLPQQERLPSRCALRLQ